MGVSPHYLPDFLIAGVCTLLIAVLFRWAKDLGSPRTAMARVVLALLWLLICATALLATVRVARMFPAPVTAWVKCLGIFAWAWVTWGFCVIAVFRRAARVQPGRREFLAAAAAAAVAAPAAVAGFAVIRRNHLTFREVEVRLPSVTPDLDGLRLVQLSDIHLSPFVRESLLARAVGMANEARADLAIITGDLISMAGDPLDACMKQLANLKPEIAAFGCMGNHEIYAGSQEYTQREGERIGLRFLRQQSVRLQFGDTPLVVTGVDYQRRGQPYLRGVEELVDPAAFNILLSHNPDVFHTAVEKKFDLTLSGHTHGGQVNFEIIHPALNVARFYTPFTYGLYENNGRGLYVTRGVGTIGVPARLGAPPEVVLIRLCATSS